MSETPPVSADAQPPAPPAFPIADGTGAVTVAFARHLDAPAVGDHIDLFIGPAARFGSAVRFEAAAHVARTYRLPIDACSADGLVAGIYDAVELPPHRAEYLELDAARELSGGRGRIEPVLRAQGHATVCADGFDARLPGFRARGVRTAGAAWRIELSIDAHSR
jgi:hypothetical protein